MCALRAALLLLLITRLPERAGAEGDEAPDDADDESDSAPFMIVVEHLESGGAGEAGGADERWRCSGSLVSLRTGVTSAECARGRPPGAARELWALAAATAAGLASRDDGARRVSRLATAGMQQAHGVEWDEALLDLAVLELESPFGSGAHARPILMATAPNECVDIGVCHVVRTLETRGGGRASLRIVDAALGDSAPCAERVPHWAAVRDRALCLTGPELCDAEWGAGVVCGGKLCGVVSRSARAPSAPPHARHCGTTHAAQSVARWRRFLHCAHTLRACGRGSCAELCSERRLLDESEESTEGSPGPDAATSTERAASAADSTRAPEREHAPHAHPVDLDLAHIAPATFTPQQANSTRVVPPTRVRPSAYTALTQARVSTVARASHAYKPTRTPWGGAVAQPLQTRARARRPPAPPAPPARPPAARPEPTPAPPAPPSLTPPAPPLSSRRPAPPSPLPRLPPLTSSSSVRPTPLFEPNRPDFRAGEYGDNAAEYGAPADEGGAGTPANASSSPASAGSTPPAADAGVSAPRTRPTPPAPPAPPPPPLAARVQHAAPASRSAASALHVHCGPLFTVVLIFLDFVSNNY